MNIPRLPMARTVRSSASEDMLKLNIWTPGLTGKLLVMFYVGFT